MIEKMLISVVANGTGALAQPASTKVAPKTQKGAGQRAKKGKKIKGLLRGFCKGLEDIAENHNDGGNRTTPSHNCKQFVAILHIFTFPPGRFTEGVFCF